MYNLPNILTLSRIAVIPLIFITVYFKSGFYDYFAGVLFILASITDYYDGKIARERGIVSAFGRLLDPIADKLLVATALVVFLAKPDMVCKYSYIPIFIILCRELLVSGLREFLREVNVGLPVTRLAKWKTGFQMVSLSMIFFHNWWIWGTIGEFLLWIAGVLTFITGYQYYAKSLVYVKADASKLAKVKQVAEAKIDEMKKDVVKKVKSAKEKMVSSTSNAKKTVNKKVSAKTKKSASKDK